jgi:DNA-binding NtrC family response regulator
MHGFQTVQNRLTLLVIEDELHVRTGLVRALAVLNCELVAVDSLAEARRVLETTLISAVLLDVRLPDGDGLEFLATHATGLLDSVAVIVATSYDDSSRVIEAMRAGAHDYLTKPFNLDRLRKVAAAALVAGAQKRAAVRPARSRPSELLGHSPAMLDVWKRVGRAAAVNDPVLILGETGTGKELVARAIHRHSPQSQGPFIAVNLAGLPASLLEAELFGHERGAFSGAIQRRMGRIEVAAGGTLFLDEIGDLDLGLQTKLLRLLQERTFERVGGSETIEARVRFVAATSMPVRPGPQARIRADLYYRLAVLEILLPPLRKRREDIPQLIDEALSRARARGITPAAREALANREWPGNVRELIHAVARASASAGGAVVDLAHLEAIETVDDLSPSEITEMSLQDVLAHVERAHIKNVLERTGGNRSAAARALGVGRAHLYSKIRQYGLGARHLEDAEGLESVASDEER